MNISQLTDSLIIELPECPTPTIKDMLRWAQRELCREGSVWIVSDGPVVVAANTCFAEIEVPAGSEALRIISIMNNGRNMVPGKDYIQSGSNGIQFVGVQPEKSTLAGEVACMPAYGQDMPGVLISRWSEVLLDGARSRLLLLPQPWQDKQLSEHYRRKFQDAQSSARSLASSGHQYGSVRMHVRGFI